MPPPVFLPQHPEHRQTSVNEFASIVPHDYDNLDDEFFDTDGSPKDSKDRPLFGLAVAKDAGLSGIQCAAPKPP